MTEAAGSVPVSGGQSAGSLLKQARLAQGMHLAVLASQIKVPPAKLEALENDRLEALPDTAFARALAKTVCRVLKVDPQPVLERLPAGVPRGLERIEGGINEPFREQFIGAPAADVSWLFSPAVWGPLLLVAASAVLMFAPIDISPVRQWIDSVRGDGGSAGSEANVRTEPGASPGVSTTIIETPISSPTATPPGAEPAPAPAPAPATVAPAAEAPPPVAEAPAGATAVLVSASAASWVEVTDSTGRNLIFRALNPGESVTLEGVPPLKVRVGNVLATKLSFRGQPVDLVALSKGNVARFELK